MKTKTSQVVTLEMVKVLSEDDIEPVKGFGILKDKPVGGLAYQKRMRAEWKGR